MSYVCAKLNPPTLLGVQSCSSWVETAPTLLPEITSGQAGELCGAIALILALVWCYKQLFKLLK